MYDETQFQKHFFLGEDSLEATFENVNIFLTENGYNSLSFNEFKKELSIDNGDVRLSAHPYVNESNRFLILTIVRYDPWNNPVDRVILELIKFRNERDWAQFHNSKDLSLAINIEASELLELFLWKGNEDAKPEKIKEELSDILLFSLLLLEKHGFDFEEILMEKIRINGEKYPASKAKGNAKKYNEL
jgi:NTP pyrophosphatase (non-canonical NTP hydrolase)